MRLGQKECVTIIGAVIKEQADVGRVEFLCIQNKTKQLFSQTESCIHLRVRCPLAAMVCLRSCILDSSGFQNKGRKTCTGRRHDLGLVGAAGRRLSQGAGKTL